MTVKLIPRNYSDVMMDTFYRSVLAWVADKWPGMDRAEMPALKEIEKFKPNGVADWGGHFYPNRHDEFGELELYPSGDWALDRAIALHELSHWIRHYTGDRLGVHDDEFFSTVYRIYVRWGVPLSVARVVETHGYPDSWKDCGDHWCNQSRNDG